MPFLRSKWAPPLLIVALVAICYWRAPSCGWIWDDDDYVTENFLLRSWGGLWRIWSEPTSLPQYYPLVHTSFWLEYRLWGLWAPGYHAVNVALHALAALLLWRLVARLGVPGACFAALWFAANPVNVESVAWVTERKNVLSMVCYLLAAGRWLAWHGGGRRRDYAVGSLWLLGALLCKTVTASLGAGVLVVVWWRAGRIDRRAWLGALPWLAVGAALGWFTAHLEATHVGAADPRWQLAAAERLLVAGRALWFYAMSLCWPFATCFNYPRWQLDAHSMQQWLPVAAAVLLVVAAALLVRRLGRGPLAVLLLFGGTLVPALGFFDVFPFRYSFVADHFQYHASLAMLVGAAAVATPVARRWCGDKAPWLAGAWLLALAFTAQQSVAQYRDLDVLWHETLARNPRSALALLNLGAAATQRGDGKAARELLRSALEFDPNSHEARINLGVVEQRAGNHDEAERLYREALRLKPNDPNVRNNLAVLSIERGDPKRAIELASEALMIHDEYFDAHATLGWALCEDGQWGAALGELDWVLARKPDMLDMRVRAVRCLVGLREFRKAAANALVVLRARPTDATARHLFAQALAEVLRAVPPEQLRAQAENVCRNAGVDPAPLLPFVAHALRELHADAQADALAPGGVGGK